MKPTSLLLLLPSFFLFLVLLKCNADDSSIDESEVFLEQTFQSEVCESADAPPHWRIDDTYLTNGTIIESYFGKVKVGHNDATGDHQSTLILKHVNLTLNGSVVSCWANSNLILNFTLVVVSIATEHLAPNDSFRPPVCKSPLAESPQPNWMINGVILNDTTVNRRYNAHVDRSGHDSKGRHQAKLIIHPVNSTLIQNGSNVTCTVGNELRMVFILYFTDPDEERTTPGAESTAHTEKVVTETSTSRASVDEPSTGSGIANIIGPVTGGVVILIILLVVLAVIIISVYVFKIRGRRLSYQDICRREADGEDDNEIDGTSRAPLHTSEEEQKHEIRVESDSDGVAEGVVHNVESDGAEEPLLRQRKK